MRIARGIVLVVCANALAPRVSQSQRMAPDMGGVIGPMFGAHVGYNFHLDNAALGVQATLPVNRSVAFYPSFDYYPVTGQTWWGLNLDVALRPPAYQFFYLGAGVNFFHVDLTGVSETSEHLNLISGLEVQMGRLRPFAEALFVVGDSTSFQLVGGANVPLQ